MPVRSLPALQWNTAGKAPGSASTCTARASELDPSENSCWYRDVTKAGSS